MAVTRKRCHRCGEGPFSYPEFLDHVFIHGERCDRKIDLQGFLSAMSNTETPAARAGRSMKHVPIPYTLKTLPLSDLVIGFKSPNGVHWDCPPYSTRPDNNSTISKQDYDRLEASIREHGISDPLITWTHPDTGHTHVLIGMRRAEIGKKLGIETVTAAEIQEDVRQWTTVDVRQRQEALKQELGQRQY